MRTNDAKVIAPLAPASCLVPRLMAGFSLTAGIRWIVNERSGSTLANLSGAVMAAAAYASIAALERRAVSSLSADTIYDVMSPG